MRSCVLLINLAVADLLVGIAEPIVLSTGKVSKMAAVRTEENNTINPASALQILASRATVFFLALISLERVYAVLWPLRHRVTNTRVYICTIVIVWVVELCTAGLTLLLSMIDAKIPAKKYDKQELYRLRKVETFFEMKQKEGKIMLKSLL